MKALTKTFATVCGVIALAGQAHAAQPEKDVRFVGDTQFSGFCKAIVQDDVRILRSAVARNVGRIGTSQREVIRLVTAENGLTCNGTSLIDFSVERHASDVHDFLVARS